MVCVLQIENIDACLGFLAAKGVNIKGLCAEGKWMCERKKSKSLKLCKQMLISLLQAYRQDVQ